MTRANLCSTCGGRGEVTETRSTDGFLLDGKSVGAVKRRRVCACGNRWTTYEIVVAGADEPVRNGGYALVSSVLLARLRELLALLPEGAS